MAKDKKKGLKKTIKVGGVNYRLRKARVKKSVANKYRKHVKNRGGKAVIRHHKGGYTVYSRGIK